MKKVCVVGHFGFGKELLNGQTIKAKAVTDEKVLLDVKGLYKVSDLEASGMRWWRL